MNYYEHEHSKLQISLIKKRKGKKRKQRWFLMSVFPHILDPSGDAPVDRGRGLSK